MGKTFKNSRTKVNKFSAFERDSYKQKEQEIIKISKDGVVKRERVKTKPSYIHSKGEAKIAEVLQGMNIKYHREHTFKGCKNPKTKALLRFDFYLPKYKIAIEYDGKHHSIRLEGVSKKQFESQVYRDNIKTDYCIKNGIDLLRIPSRKFSQIEVIIKGYIK